MSYHWNWGILLSPVSTGEPTTYLGWLMSGLATTLIVSVCAWLIAVAVGTMFGIARTTSDWRLTALGTAYVAVFRNIPLIVQFFIWYLVVPELLPVSIGGAMKALAPTTQFYLTSIVCLGLFTGARVCEQVRSGIRALPRGQRGAALALGLTSAQTYRFVLLPVAFRTILPPLTSEFVSVFKNSAVASTIGLLDLSAQARQLVDYTAQTYESFIAVTVAYIAINLFVLRGMRFVEARVRIVGMTGER
jgi:glutamate/aspartate transport system permease protein